MDVLSREVTTIFPTLPPTNVIEGMEHEGKHSGGKVLKGASLFKVEGQKPIASIPAKFETVLFVGAREKKGFGSVSRRFGDQEQENPGPATYGQQNSLEYKHESISKKGYGPMSSSARRWKSRMVYSPGPGEYTQPAPAEQDSTKDFNRGKTSSAFSEPVKPVKPVSREVEPTPGPGTYQAEEVTRNGQNLEWNANSHTHMSAFKATPHKLHLNGNLESPSPTKYDVADPWASTSSMNKAASRTPSKGGLSSFAGRSVSSTVGGPSDPAFYLTDPKEVKKPETGPGPGSYELQYFQGIKQTLEKSAGKMGANFQPLDYVDRFGRSLAPHLNGGAGGNGFGDEGNANKKLFGGKIESPTRGVISPFKSTIPGRAEYNLTEAGKAPGPAFYSPQKSPKRSSHHLNARKRMVT